MIMVVTLIVFIGAYFGAVGYLLTQQKEVPSINVTPTLNIRCSQKAKVSPICSAVGYEFDLNQIKCVIVNGAGCIDKLPFSTLEECQNVCEEKTETKTAVIGEEFLITLDANPSTGYSWDADFDESYFILRSKDFIHDKVSPDKIGAGGKEVFTFAPIKTGEATITMDYGRPWESRPSKTKVFRYSIKEKTIQNQDVSIATDKMEYKQGETVNIIVNNGLDKPILYYGGGDRFWGIEYFKDDKWINPDYEESGGFQLTEKNIGDACYIALYERSFPEKLALQSNITAQWNQKICPFGIEGPDKPKIVRYIL